MYHLKILREKHGCQPIRLVASGRVTNVDSIVQRILRCNWLREDCSYKRTGRKLRPNGLNVLAKRCWGRPYFAISNQGVITNPLSRSLGNRLGKFEVHLREAPPLLTGGLRFLLPKVKSVSYSVYRKEDDVPFLACGNSIRQHKRLGKMLNATVKERDIEWRVLREESEQIVDLKLEQES